jgi:hypothetical protein
LPIKGESIHTIDVYKEKKYIMALIIQDPFPRTDYPGFAKGGDTCYASQMTSLTQHQQENTDITIITAEGDRVTHSSASERVADYQTYTGLARGKGAMARVQEKSYSMEVNQDLSITIEGNLSEEELNDIQEAIKILDKIMHEALTGNMDHALAMTQDVSVMGSISGFSASREVENTLSFMQQTIVETQTKGHDPADEIGPAIDSPSRDRFSLLIDKMTEVLNHQGFRKRKFIKPLNAYFSKLLKGISEKHGGPDKGRKMGMVHHIRSEILGRLEREALQGPISGASSESSTDR